MKALEKLREISRALAPCGIETAEREAELFVMRGLNADLIDLYRDNPELDDMQTLAIDEMVERRSKREPLQYIVGYNGFLGLKLFVGKGVLIPRPETEIMAEYAINKVKSQKSEVRSQGTEEGKQITSDEGRLKMLDLCTGSGCLALSLAKEFPGASVYGVDISEAAIRYANKNAQFNEIKNVSFINGHLFTPLGKNQFFDLIISNPPYIRTDEIQCLQPEIRDWEPLNALDGGADGLDFYREIVPEARKFLKDRGILMFELGVGCTGNVATMLQDTGYSEVEILKDYAGVERIIEAQWTR
jgi:release factor glutamine methyltransferase